MTERLFDAVLCSECRFVSLDLSRVHCPDCDRAVVLGERQLTSDEIAGRRAEHHNELVVASVREEAQS